MEIILGTIVAVLVLLSLGLTGCTEAQGGAPTATTQQAAPPEPTAPPELRRQLAELAQATPPNVSPVNACCYKPAPLVDRFEHLCPTCHTKTILAKEPRFAERLRQLEICRRLVKEIKGLDITLTETGFCATCTPEAKEAVIGIRIRYGEDRVHTCAPVTPEDLTLLAEFQGGKQVHATGMGGEKPLRDYVKRLAELLGTGPVDN